MRCDPVYPDARSFRVATNTKISADAAFFAFFAVHELYLRLRRSHPPELPATSCQWQDPYDRVDGTRPKINAFVKPKLARALVLAVLPAAERSRINFRSPVLYRLTHLHHDRTLYYLASKDVRYIVALL